MVLQIGHSQFGWRKFSNPSGQCLRCAVRGFLFRGFQPEISTWIFLKNQRVHFATGISCREQVLEVYLMVVELPVHIYWEKTRDLGTFFEKRKTMHSKTNSATSPPKLCHRKPYLCVASGASIPLCAVVPCGNGDNLESHFGHIFRHPYRSV